METSTAPLSGSPVSVGNMTAKKREIVDVNSFPSANRNSAKLSDKPMQKSNGRRQSSKESSPMDGDVGQELFQILHERNLRLDLGAKFNARLQEPEETYTRYQPVGRSGRSLVVRSFPQPYVRQPTEMLSFKAESPPPPLPTSPPPPPPPGATPLAPTFIETASSSSRSPAHRTSERIPTSKTNLDSSQRVETDQTAPAATKTTSSPATKTSAAGSGDTNENVVRRGRLVAPNGLVNNNNVVDTNDNNNRALQLNVKSSIVANGADDDDQSSRRSSGPPTARFASPDEPVEPRMEPTGVDWDPTALLNHLYRINLNRPDYFSEACPFPLPTQGAPKNNSKKIIIIDLGHCSMRAGVLCTYPSLPEVFFPSVTATTKNSSGKVVARVFGADALTPEMRRKAVVAYPLGHRLGTKVSPEEYKFGVYLDCFEDLFQHIFEVLKVDPRHYKILLSIPQNFAPTVKMKIMDLLLDKFRVSGVTAAHQNILALYAYDVTTGVVVNIGDRVDVTPVLDGYCISDGVSRMGYGGEKMCDQMAHHLADARHSFFSDVDRFLVRFVKEQTCFVADDLQSRADELHLDPEAFTATVDLKPFGVRPSPAESGKVTVDGARFLCPEGLMSPAVWGLDNQGLPYLVSKAIMAAGIDGRRQMAKSIYLCGAGSLLPGLPQRLESEVAKLLPSPLKVQVHSHPFRDHASFLGATVFAELQVFDRLCVTRQEWDSASPDSPAKFALLNSKWLVPF